MPTIEVTPEIAIDQSELAFSFARAGGPGSQNVNKVETAAHGAKFWYIWPPITPPTAPTIELLSGPRVNCVILAKMLPPIAPATRCIMTLMIVVADMCR
ncbi:MAG: hypothetical protein ACREDG_00930, partial [Methylocella sp.]